MSRRAEPLPAWQLRLAPDEDAYAASVAEAERISKNDVVRRAVRLLASLDRERKAGARLLIERSEKAGKRGGAVELWPLW